MDFNIEMAMNGGRKRGNCYPCLFDMKKIQVNLKKKIFAS